jgi:hypothetical protein
MTVKARASLLNFRCVFSAKAASPTLTNLLSSNDKLAHALRELNADLL